MNKIILPIIVFYFLFCIQSVCQVTYPVYNPSDSTFTFTFYQSLEIAKTKKEKRLLEKEVKILNDLGGQNEKVIQKLMYKDSLSRLELDHYEKMNQNLIHKIENKSLIIDTYQKNLDEVKLELQDTKTKLRREKFWKNMYKFGTPAIATLIFFILK